MSNKPLISGFEKIILLGLVAFFGYGIYKNGGISLYEKTEDITIFDGKTTINSSDPNSRSTFLGLNSGFSNRTHM